MLILKAVMLSLLLASTGYKKQSDSELFGRTEVGGEKLDLTLYKTSDPAILKASLNQMGRTVMWSGAEDARKEMKAGTLKPKGDMHEEDVMALRAYTFKGDSILNNALRTKMSKAGLVPKSRIFI
ncbi:MAG: hypothetical protein H7249_13090 [Chitinophagaceae bacterium]|nr:hypothetical protein [Oligoflexus sp.]